MHRFLLSRLRHTIVRTMFAITMMAYPSSMALAQQSLFNVPSANVTPKGELFVQEQLNFGTSIESNLTLDVGLGSGFEVGLNLMHLRLFPAEAVVSPDDAASDAFLINAQWIIPALPGLNIAFGTEQGISARTGQDGVGYVGWEFAALRIEPKHGRYGGYVLGGYYGTKTWTGVGPSEGGLLGFEIPLVADYVSVCADWMVGTNRQSVAALGIQLMPEPAWGWQLSLGAQLPGFGLDTGYALVVEITRMGSRQEPHAPRSTRR